MNILKSIMQSIMLISSAVFVCSCDQKENKEENNPVAVYGIRLSPTNVQIAVGQTLEYIVTVLPENAENRNYSFTVDNDAIVSISDEGILNALTEGNAKVTVTAQDGGFRAVSYVEVVSTSSDPDLVIQGIEMVFVEGGTFTMGATEDQDKYAENRERPAHSVTLSDFYIGKYEVTQAQWKAVMGSDIIAQYNAAKESNIVLFGTDNEDEGVNVLGDNYPMFYVCWSDAIKFIERLNEISGKNYRLLTEAEWEYAARGGNLSSGSLYSGSNDIDAIAWYNLNSEATSHEVGTKQPNELGIYDMSGSMWEWVNDYAGFYSDGLQVDPKGPEKGDRNIMRGGSWGNDATFCRVSYRDFNYPTARFLRSGIRLAMSAR